MLVLTRKPGERLVIADNIVVTVVDVKGDNIRIGIDAPREVKVYRGEIYDASSPKTAKRPPLPPT